MPADPPTLAAFREAVLAEARARTCGRVNEQAMDERLDRPSYLNDQELLAALLLILDRLPKRDPERERLPTGAPLSNCTHCGGMLMTAADVADYYERLEDENRRLKEQLADLRRAWPKDPRYVDATPDAGYPARILAAYIDEGVCSGDGGGEELAALLNVAQQERNAILRRAIDLIAAHPAPVGPAPRFKLWLKAECRDYSPPEFSGRWRDWHRGSGCSLDDGRPRTPEGAAEIAALGVDHKPAAPAAGRTEPGHG